MVLFTLIKALCIQDRLSRMWMTQMSFFVHRVFKLPSSLVHRHCLITSYQVISELKQSNVVFLLWRPELRVHALGPYNCMCLCPDCHDVQIKGNRLEFWSPHQSFIVSQVMEKAMRWANPGVLEPESGFLWGFWVLWLPRESLKPSVLWTLNRPM